MDEYQQALNALIELEKRRSVGQYDPNEIGTWAMAHLSTLKAALGQAVTVKLTVNGQVPVPQEGKTVSIETIDGKVKEQE